MTRVRDIVVALAVFSAAAIAVTWPLAAHIRTESVQHGDVYFNMWRMEWFAHALRTDPSHLFDANIFYPEPRTLAYSDAMLLEDSLAAPFYAARVPPVLVHNLMLLGGMVLSALGMYLLTRHFTRSSGPGLVAGIVFAFAPYRIEHIAHMELQWAIWAPLAFLALHRLLETGRSRYGLATGTCLALQMLSSIYYGAFLAVLLAIGAVLLFVLDRRASVGRTAAALAAGAAIAIVIAAVYSLPYASTHSRVGDRPIEEVLSYSARPADYSAVPPQNRLYGGRLHGGAGERRLFPGLLILGLAGVGLLTGRPRRRIVAYALLLAVAFDMTLGLDGITFRFLYQHVSAFRSLRASARSGLFVLLFLSVLGAYGVAAVTQGLKRMPQRIALAVLVVLLVAEYSTAVTHVPFPNSAPPLYRVLKQQPLGIVAEFPVPRVDRLPGADPAYAYMSTFHWFPLVNGYSGNYPPSYLARIERFRNFPDERSLAQLRADNVRYVIVHANGYSNADFSRISEHLLATHRVVELGAFQSAEGSAVLYLFRGI